MNPAMLKLMRAKKKRPVDPNAPPRPNLMSHDKTIRDQKATIDTLTQDVLQLRQQVEALTAKLNYQTQYLAQLHQHILGKRR